MQIVIDINDEIYKEILNGKDGWSNYVHGLIRIGTPLPKGHGRLVDENDLSLMTVHMIDGVLVCDASTIIEAERSRKNEQR